MLDGIQKQKTYNKAMSIDGLSTWWIQLILFIVINAFIYGLIKSSKRKRKKRKSEKMSQDELDKDNDGYAWVYHSATGKMIQKCVVKTTNCVELVPLTYNDNADTNNDNDDAVRGAGVLEEKGFNCGILEIPPSSEKYPEFSYFTEQFFVHQCEKKKLLFKLGEDEFYLSMGTMFFVPPANEYSLRNLSTTHTVQLTFTLIKH